MEKKEDVIEKQKDFIANLKQKTNRFINTIDKSEIETILLSGSVSRGDYFPGKIDGMVDLIVMKKAKSSITAEQLFGENIEPEIPYHCVKSDGTGYAVLFTDFIDLSSFCRKEEPRKFSILESQILYDPNKYYEKELVKINQFAEEEQKRELSNGIGYIDYLISEYKKDRWYRRGAYIQMHENLNTAIRTGVKCLFYINGFYSPAEDRALYYSHSLKKLPEKYNELISQSCDQVTNSEEDYFRRENVFMEKIVSYIRQFTK